MLFLFVTLQHIFSSLKALHVHCSAQIVWSLRVMGSFFFWGKEWWVAKIALITFTDPEAECFCLCYDIIAVAYGTSPPYGIQVFSFVFMHITYIVMIAIW